MAEHLRGAVYEGPANNANQVVSNLQTMVNLYILKVVYLNGTQALDRITNNTRHGVSNSAAKYQFIPKAYLNHYLVFYLRDSKEN